MSYASANTEAAAGRWRALRALIPDLDEQLPRFRTDSEAVDAEIFGSFLDYLGQLAEDMAVAIAAGDGGKIRAVGHSIKGMGGSCGAPEVSVIGLELEAAGRSADFARAQALLDALRRWRESFPEAGAGRP